MSGEDEAEYENHALAEGIEFVEPEQYPKKAYEIAGELDIDPAEHESFGEDGVTLYRGDTAMVFEDIDDGDHLRRDFPIYFADNGEDAVGYADAKLDETEKILLEVEVPYEQLEVSGKDQGDIENGSEILEPGTVYFIGSNLALNGGDRHLEFAATEIPKDWVSVESID